MTISTFHQPGPRKCTETLTVRQIVEAYLMHLANTVFMELDNRDGLLYLPYKDFAGAIHA